MNFIESIMERAKKEKKKIVLPEAYDSRVTKAASILLDKEICDVVLLGEKEKIYETAGEADISRAEIINPIKHPKFEEYTDTFYEMRKHKGMTLEKAKEMMEQVNYFGVMMVKKGHADGMVSGAVHSTADTLRPSLQILKTAAGTKIVSSFFIMVVPDCEYGENGTFLFSDCGLVMNPDENELAEIALSSAKSFEALTEKESKVAMLSFSSHGSACDPLVEKVVKATEIAKKTNPDIKLDGELQLDAAIIPKIGKSKAPESTVAGYANTLIFPDLNSGNIGYKLVERLAKAQAYGPITQGIAKPVNDLSRGCSAQDIVGVAAITAVQATDN